MQHRMKNSTVDGSFMVVPPGSNSYMSSSAMWGSGHIPSNSRPAPPANNSGTAGVRARANRVQQTKRGAATPASNRHVHPPQTGLTAPSKNNNSAGLESSWWGNASAASQILTSSVISVGSRTGGEMGNGVDMGQQANTKQLMRLMDSLKTLGDENAALLREVEEAEVARQEAKAAREQMKRFKTEYGKRFSMLKAALEKFSEFSRKASVADQLQRQEQLIRKLTSDLKKEKEESKKKDAALRKYESFYREVKARSAQKAAQRQMENQQRQHKTRNSSTRAIR
jgi:myosin heavy subunit